MFIRSCVFRCQQVLGIANTVTMFWSSNIWRCWDCVMLSMVTDWRLKQLYTREPIFSRWYSTIIGKYAYTVIIWFSYSMNQTAICVRESLEMVNIREIGKLQCFVRLEIEAKYVTNWIQRYSFYVSETIAMFVRSDMAWYQQVICIANTLTMFLSSSIWRCWHCIVR